LEWNFILFPDFKQDLGIKSEELEFQRKATFYSPEYGKILKTDKLGSRLKTKVPVEVKFSIKIK